MNWHSLYLGFFLLWAFVAPILTGAQARGEAPSAPGFDVSGNPETVEAALHQMSDRAAVVFVGTVQSVRRPETEGTGAGVVEIQFNIEQAIRGCSGNAFTLREWSGLWVANDTRYHVGQHLLMLLHAPAATGLSSPVGGMDGAIPLRASGAGLRSPDATSAPAQTVADLRWIGARLARTVTYRTPTPPAAAPAFPHTLSSEPEQSPRSTESADASTPAQEANISTVVDMLRSWEVAHVR